MMLKSLMITLRRNDEGEIIVEEFFKPMGIRSYRLVENIHVPARRIHEIVLKTG